MTKYKLVQHTNFCTKKASTKPSNTSNENFDNTGKQIAETSLTVFKNMANRNKQNTTNGKCEKRGSGIEANVRKSKHAKVRNQSQKIRKGVLKSTAKNKATF